MPNKVEIIATGVDAGATKVLKEVGATARAEGKATAEAKRASALAAKLEGDTVSEQSLRIIKAIQAEGAASKDYRAISALTRKGVLDEAEGARATAAAYQRLTAAKLETAEASRIQAIASKSAASDSLSIREHIGGLSIGGSMRETLTGAAEALALGELASKLREAITSSMQFGEEIQRASEKTGLAAETLSTLHYAAAVTGGDFDKMTAAVAKMDKAIGAATEGNKAAQAFMRSLGLNAKEIANSPDGAEIAFRKFAKTLSDTENPIRRVELATGLLGKAGAEQIPTLIDLGNNWDAWKQKAIDAGVYLDGPGAAALAETNQKLNNLKQQVLGASLALTTGLTPSLTKMFDVISGGKGSMDVMKDWGASLGKTMSFLAEVLYSAAAAAELMFSTMAGGALTDAGKRDLAAFHELKAQAQQFHDIAFAKPGEATAAPPTASVTKGGGEGFEGIGDQSGAAEKAARERLKVMEDNLHQMQLNTDVSVKAQFDYWDRMRQTLVQGSAGYLIEYRAIIDKMATLAEEGAKRAHSAIERFLQQDKKRQGENAPIDMLNGLDAWKKQDARAMEDRADTSNELYAQHQKVMAQLEEMQVHEQTGKAIDRESASMQIAAIHTAEYGAELERLEAKRKAIEENPLLTKNEDDRQKQIDDLKKKIAELQGGREIQVAQDVYAVKDADSSAVRGATEALEEFTYAATDATSVMKSWFSGALGSTNNAIVKMLTEPASQTRGEHVFGQVGHEVFTSATSSLLKGAEGSLLKSLGIGGKKDGSSESNAMWVRIAGMLGSGPNPLSKLPGMTDSLGNLSDLTPKSGDASSPTGNVVSRTTAMLLHLIPGFADGGDFAGGSPMIVGENGPELMLPRSSGAVLPNKALGGGSPDIHFHTGAIDARGATDPAAVHDAAMRAIMAVAPHIAAGANAASRERTMRLPSGQR